MNSTIKTKGALCSSDCSTQPRKLGTARGRNKLVLQLDRRAAIMAYQFEPLLHRMVDKYGWTTERAADVFEDLKQFLYLATIAKGTLAPSEAIDDMWHNFILFTRDYHDFCNRVAGMLIHHRPRRRDDLPPTGVSPIAYTRRLARETFGKLSVNWTYSRPDGTTVTAGCDAVCNGHCCPSFD